MNSRLGSFIVVGRCTRCYTRHRNEQQLCEQESSDRVSVLEVDYDWMYDQMVITPHDPSVSLNPPVLAPVAPAPVPAILAPDDISINTIWSSPLTRRPPHDVCSTPVLTDTNSIMSHGLWTLTHLR